MTALSLVASAASGPAETLSQQVRRLQTEAKDLARAHAQCLEVALLAVGRLASEVAEGGDAYPPGIRELARQAAADSAQRAQLLQAILVRN